MYAIVDAYFCLHLKNMPVAACVRENHNSFSVCRHTIKTFLFVYLIMKIFQKKISSTTTLSLFSVSELHYHWQVFLRKHVVEDNNYSTCAFDSSNISIPWAFSHGISKLGIIIITIKKFPNTNSMQCNAMQCNEMQCNAKE